MASDLSDLIGPIPRTTEQQKARALAAAMRAAGDAEEAERFAAMLLGDDA